MFRKLTAFAMATLIASPAMACKMTGKDELFMNYIQLGERVYSEPVPLAMPEVGYTDENGRRTSLSEHFGKPLVVTLWHPRCTGCKVDLPALNRFLEENPQIDEAQFIQISVEQLFEGARNYSVDDVKGFLQSKSYGKIDANLDIGNELFRANCMVATPTHLLLNSEGKVMEVLFGAFPWPDSPFADDIRKFLATN